MEMCKRFPHTHGRGKKHRTALHVAILTNGKRVLKLVQARMHYFCPTPECQKGLERTGRSPQLKCFCRRGNMTQLTEQDGMLASVIWIFYLWHPHECSCLNESLNTCNSRYVSCESLKYGFHLALWGRVHACVDQENYSVRSCLTAFVRLKRTLCCRLLPSTTWPIPVNVSRDLNWS